MATHQSAIKRHRQNLKRRERNRQARSAMRTLIQNAFESINAGDAQKAREATRLAVRTIDKAVVHGLLHKSNGRNRVSRLMRRLASVSA